MYTDPSPACINVLFLFSVCDRIYQIYNYNAHTLTCAEIFKPWPWNKNASVPCQCFYVNVYKYFNLFFFISRVLMYFLHEHNCSCSCTLLQYVKVNSNYLTHQHRGEGAKIKIHQFNFELTFSGLISKGNDLSQCSPQCALWIYGLTIYLQVSVSFLKQLDLKNKCKPQVQYIPIRR